MFDPDQFLASTTSEAGSTRFEPLPAGEYMAIIEDVAKPRPAGERVVMDVTFKLMNVPADVAAAQGKSVFTVRKGYFLDITPNNALDMGKGKNIDLNRLREAVGQNTPGKPWKPLDLKGAGPVKVQVTLRPDKNSDAVYNDVKSVGKA